MKGTERNMQRIDEADRKYMKSIHSADLKTRIIHNQKLGKQGLNQEDT